MPKQTQVCIARTLKIIGGKWTIQILCELFSGTKRFGELQKALNGISPKTLAARLKELEKQGIINKKIYAQIPLKVEYSLTPKGKSLNDIINKVHEWGEKFYEDPTSPEQQ